MERLGILKVRYDLTYNKLALLIGVTDDKAGNYLSGRTKMPMQKVIELSAALRIDANWLLRGVGVSPIHDLVGIKSEPITSSDLVSEQTPKARFDALANSAFDVIFDELQSLKQQIAHLEERLNDTNK